MVDESIIEEIVKEGEKTLAEEKKKRKTAEEIRRLLIHTKERLLSEEEFMYLLNNVPRNMKNVLMSARKVEHSIAELIDAIISIALTEGRGAPLGTLSTVTVSYSALIKDFHTILEECKSNNLIDDDTYNKIKEEINKLHGIITTSITRSGDASKAAVLMITAIKLFIDLYIYQPAYIIVRDRDKILIKEFAKVLTHNIGTLGELLERISKYVEVLR